MYDVVWILVIILFILSLDNRSFDVHDFFCNMNQYSYNIYTDCLHRPVCQSSWLPSHLQIVAYFDKTQVRLVLDFKSKFSYAL